MSNRQGEIGAKSDPTDIWVIDLPTGVRGNHARLRNTAANLLQLAHVRAVIIDDKQGQAIVKLQKSFDSAGPLASIPELDDADLALEATELELSPAAFFSWTDPRDRSLCFIRLPSRAKGWRRGLLLLASGAALLLGLLGVILPGLPTTPFVLVASYCLLRSSPRLHTRLLENRLFGDVLRDWHLHRGIRRHVRYKATAVIVLVLGVSLVLTSLPMVAKLVILAIAACGITYVWRLPEVSRRATT